MVQSAEGHSTEDQAHLLKPRTSYGINVGSFEVLKRSIDIVSVVEAYGLKQFERKSSTRATACCPFHKDKSPSLSVDAGRGIYKCFGCGVGGDVFSFVREYAKLRGEDMTYYESIRRVQDDWGDPTLDVFLRPASRLPSKSTEQDEKMNHRIERVLAANRAAASYYAACLLQPRAGAVRSYIRSRGITASTVSAYGLGYAPNVYPTNYRNSRGGTASGAGGLIEHLKSLGFTTAEILDAGLATQTKTKAAFSQVMQTEEKLDSNSTEATKVIDRFRDRLIVPILDRSGKNVIALGGRIVPQSAPALGSFEPAKYINSPESPVFTKGSTLFNEGAVHEHLKTRPRQGVTVPSRRSVILVEGYMDAISLWNAGVKEVVASMGTALSMEQLSAAARLAQPVEGRVVLCLDNDAAGIAAVERLCSNGILKEVSEKYKVDIRVATMPEGIKDPDDYVQLWKGKGSVGEAFVENVIQAAADWNMWFIDRILLSYNPEAKKERIGSFGDIFNRVAEHLATLMNSADRTRSAYNVADALAEILAKEKNATEVSDAVRAQLESDLIEESARLASVRNSIRRRTEAASVGKADVNVNMALRALSKGEGPSGIENSIPTQTKSSALASPLPLNDSKKTSKLARSPTSSTQEKAVKRASDVKPRALRPRSATALTPHFAGFRFSNKSDQDWLANSSPSKVKRASERGATVLEILLSLISRQHLFGSSPPPAFRRRSSDNVVYFNSNQYHGVHFLTDDAERAGYQRGTFDRDPALMEVGISSLLKPDIQRQAQIAEDGLLRTLIVHRSARTSLKNMIDARDAVGFSIEMKWSSPAKSWLFDSLLGRTEELPTSIEEPRALRDFLANFPSCPSNSLSKKTEDDGTDLTESFHARDGFNELDHLFTTVDETSPLHVFDSRIIEFEVQQYYSTLLRTAATMRLNELKQAMDDVVQEMGGKSSTRGDDQLDKDVESVDCASIDLEFKRLAEDVLRTSRTLQSLTNAANLASSRQLHASISTRQGGLMSETLQAELGAKLDEHLSNLQMTPRASEFDRQHGIHRRDETAQETLDRVERDWGKWYDDDYQWLPHDN